MEQASNRFKELNIAAQHLNRVIKRQPAQTPKGTKPEPVKKTEPKFDTDVVKTERGVIKTEPQIPPFAPVASTLIKNLNSIKERENKRLGRQGVTADRLNKINNLTNRIQKISSKKPEKTKTVNNITNEVKKAKLSGKSFDDLVSNQKEKLYHGTNADFKVFDKKKIGTSTDNGLFGKGFYFGNTKAFAEVAPKGGIAKNVIEAYPVSANFFDIAKIKSVKEMSDLLNMAEDTLIKSPNNIIRPKQEYSGRFTSKLQDLGYDGVRINRGGDAVETVIFEPENIITKAQLKDEWDNVSESVKADKITATRASSLRPGELIEQGGKSYRITQAPWYANDKIHLRASELTKSGNLAGKTKTLSFSDKPKTAPTATKKANTVQSTTSDGKRATGAISSEKKPISKEVDKPKPKTDEERRQEAIKGMSSKDKKIRLDSAKVIKELLDKEREAKVGKITVTKIEEDEMAETLANEVKRSIDGNEDGIVPDSVFSGLEKKELKNKLEDLMERGKDENYFRDMSFKAYDDFLSGAKDVDESVIIDDFIEEKFVQPALAIMRANKDVVLQSRVFAPLSALSTATNISNKVWQKVLGDKAWNGLKAFAGQLSRVKIGGESSIFYPFEFLTGYKKSQVSYPVMQKIRRKEAETSEELYSIGMELEKFSKEERTTITNNIIEGKYEKRATDPLQMAAFKIEERFFAAGYNLVKAGILPVESFKEYVGRYLPNLFNVFETAAKGKGVKNNIKMDQRYLKSRRDGWQVVYREKGKQVTKKFEKKLERDLFAETLTAKGIKNRKKNPLTEEYINETLGGRLDLIPTVKIGLKNEIMDYEKSLIFSEIAKNTEIARADKDVANGFVNQIPDNKLYGDLAGMYVHQHYISDIRNSVMQPEIESAIARALWNGLKSVTSVVKSFKTIYDPSVIVANNVSNIILADMAGVPFERADYWIRNLYNSLPALIDPHKGKGSYAELRKLGITGKTMMLEIQQGINPDIELANARALLKFRKNGTSVDVLGTMYNVAKKFHLKAGEAYSFAEDVAKSTVYDWNVRELGKSKIEAAEEAQRAIFDYGQVSDAVDFLRKFQFGPAFVTFSAKLIPTMMETIVRKPFTILKYSLLWKTLTATSLAVMSGAAISGKEDTKEITGDDINKLKGNLAGGWYTPTSVEYDERTGKIKNIKIIDYSRHLPFGQVTTPETAFDDIMDAIPKIKMGSFGITADSEKGFLDAFAPGGIIIPPIISVMSNNDSFTGKEIYNKRDSDYERGKDIYNYLQRALGPGLAPSLLDGFNGKGGYMYEKLYKAFSNSDLSGYSYSGEDLNEKESLLRFSGLKTVDIKPEEQNKFKLIGFIKEIDEVKKEIRNLHTKTQNTLNGIKKIGVENDDKRKERLEADREEQMAELNKRLAEIVEERDEWTKWYNEFISSTKIK